MNNIIPTRIYGFLREYLPFSLLSKAELLELSENVVVKYVQPGEVVFRQGDATRSFIYIVCEGAIHLVLEEEGDSVLIDECDEGDVFGLRPLLTGEPYALTAIAEEESLLYALKVEGVAPFLERYPKIGAYFAKAFAAGVRNPGSGLLHKKDSQPKEDAVSLTEIQSISPQKAPVTCSAGATIREAALLMRENQVGSMIVANAEGHPMGILTDKDLRNKVVAGDLSPDAAVTAIMSAPVITLPPRLTVADVQIAMMKHHIHHICLTADGTPHSRVVGIVSEHDLLVTQGNHPAIFIREIRRCQNGDSLRAIREKAEALLHTYLLQEVSMQFISSMMSEINNALIGRAIQLCEGQMKEEWPTAIPEVKWAWLTLGSEGREEQLLRTDQDNALVFEDVPPDQLEEVKKYFLSLAEKITDMLHRCGFDFCPGDMMARNPDYCMPLGGWKKLFSNWIHAPTEKNIMMCNIFFDFRPTYGEKSLAEALAEHIFGILEKDSIFFAMLARDALKQPPPLTFFRNFVVEKSGEHKDEFDIKARAMLPLVDAARLLILEARQPGVNNTFLRFQHLARLEPQNRELFEQAADAYEMLMRYRALQGLQNKDSGRYIKPSELSKMERLNLRNAFQPIGELQELIKVRFRLSLI